MAKKNLSAKQVAALSLLVGGQTQDQVAATVGTKANTIRDWLKDPTFREELRLAQERMRQIFEARVMGLANNAAVVLGEMIADTEDRDRQLEGVKLAFNSAVRLSNRYKELQVEGYVAPAQPLVVFPAGTRFPWQNRLEAPVIPLEISEGDPVIDAEIAEVADSEAD
jgi:hypothetical protein